MNDSLILRVSNQLIQILEGQDTLLSSLQPTSSSTSALLGVVIGSLLTYIFNQRTEAKKRRLQEMENERERVFTMQVCCAQVDMKLKRFRRSVESAHEEFVDTIFLYDDSQLPNDGWVDERYLFAMEKLKSKGLSDELDAVVQSVITLPYNNPDLTQKLMELIDFVESIPKELEGAYHKLLLKEVERWPQAHHGYEWSLRLQHLTNELRQGAVDCLTAAKEHFEQSYKQSL